MTDPTIPAPPRPAEPGPRFLDWVLVALLTALMAVIAVFGVFYLPIYIGAVPVPVSVLPVALALALIPRVAYRLTSRMWAAMAPVLAWLVVSVGLYVVTNSLYLSVPVTWRGWQFVLLMGVGALSAAASVGLLWGDHMRAQYEARVPAAPRRAEVR